MTANPLRSWCGQLTIEKEGTMKTVKYAIIKDETIRRTERVEYIFAIPVNIRNKKKYAVQQLEDNNYLNCAIIDILESELLDDNVVHFKRKHSSISRIS